MESEGRGFTGISISPCGVQSGKERVSKLSEQQPRVLTVFLVPSVGLTSNYQRGPEI